MSRLEQSALIAWPANAAVNRVVPKTKIYEHAAVNSRLKDLFVKQVDQITWLCKLASETINLPAKDGVSEIQIFSIRLKMPTLHIDVLHCIDRAISHPIFFELHYERRVQIIARFKRPTGGSAEAKLPHSDYFAGPWLPQDARRNSLPTTLDLAGLYEQLFLQLVPLPPRPNESLPALIRRVAEARDTAHELTKAVAALENEKQFNRKVELNANVRSLRMKLAQLDAGERGIKP